MVADIHQPEVFRGCRLEPDIPTFHGVPQIPETDPSLAEQLQTASDSPDHLPQEPISLNVKCKPLSKVQKLNRFDVADAALTSGEAAEIVGTQEDSGPFR